MVKISVLGTGNMGKALVKLLASNNNLEVSWGSRDRDRVASLAEKMQLSNVATSDYEEAYRSDIIIPALPFTALLEWAAEHKAQLKDKQIVDISNPFNDDFSGFTTVWGESAAERLQAALPDSIVIGAFKNTFFKVMENPVFQKQQSDVLVTGDDEASVERLISLLRPLPFRFIQAGMLANNRTIERFTLLELELAVRYGTYPYISMRVFGMKDEASAD
ncbi:NADPH-dependent F420 reductase [Paenibacillus humicola]|uniref:NADPH-dependent F420 reductase n=1 Tax=Paenibacillus humicola TaxID=3110540 RepID=UPI00237B937F|nr:NAD(P)-binding domain-containing protein [Paenibacillus humicola]